MPLKVYGDCEGPLGFPMKSDVAKAVESVLKTVPQECQDLGLMRIAKASAMQEFSDGERADISFVTTESVDRDREVLLVKGGDFSQFKKNPTVTFAHKYDELPVGRCMWLKMDEKSGNKGWLAKTQYISRPADWSANTAWFPDAIWHYVRSGNLPGKSIGFIALECRPPEEKEIVARPELAKVRRVIPKWLALEYAVCAVPSNPDTMTEATAKARLSGILIPDMLLEEFGMVIPDGTDTKMKPAAGEARADFMKRCVPAMIGEGKEQAQAVAMCSVMFGDEKPADKPKVPPKKMMEIAVAKRVIAEGIARGLREIDIAGMVRETLQKMRGRV